MEDSNSSKTDDDDADAGSVSSSTTAGSASSVVSRYFEPSDFLPWEELYSRAEYAPHVGFAVVAGGFACLHPFVFFAGVVTAFGALRAATHTYEYAMCSTTTDKQQQQIVKEDNVRSTSTLISTMKSCDCPPNIIGFNFNKNNGNNIADTEKTAHSITKDDDVPALAETASSSSTVESLSENVADGDFIDNNNNYNIDVVSSSVPFIMQSPSKRKVDEESTDPIKWIKGKNPDLPTIALDYVEFRGLNANEFFDVFFADDAPFGFPAFHKLRRDKEVQYGTWDTVTTTHTSSDSDSNINTPNNNNIVSNINNNDDAIPSSIIVKERAVKYHAKTNSFLGPPYAPTTKTQRAYFSTKFLVIEIKTTLKDIPFCNRFYLIERWIIDGTGTGAAPSSNRNGNSSRTNCNKNRKNELKQHHNTQKDHNNNPSKASHSHCIYLTVTSKVYFTDECPFESVVVKESAKQISEISKSWNTMAQDGLKQSEETRRKRLQIKKAERLQKEQQMKVITSLLSTATTNNFDADGSIEIEHIDDSIRKGTRRRSSTSQQHQQQQPSQQQPRRLLRNRSISQSFSKLLVRNSTMNAADSNQEISLPKVRISSS